jgi:hypothetical protein
MKKAIGRAVNYAARNPLLSLGKILVLNMDHYDRTILKLNRVLYHHVFKKSVWPFVLRYGMWVFDYGKVDRTRCDGGWVNWSMYGHHKKDGGYVTFYARWQRALNADPGLRCDMASNTESRIPNSISSSGSVF